MSSIFDEEVAAASAPRPRRLGASTPADALESEARAAGAPDTSSWAESCRDVAPLLMFVLW